MQTGGATALMYACQQCRESDVLDILRKQPYSVKERDRTLKTPLHYCAENPNTNCAEALLKAAPELVNAQDENGYCPLHLAVIAGNKSLIKLLIGKGADVNFHDNEGHSAVHWAIVSSEKEALEMIIRAGANPSTPDIHGGYPLHYAVQMCGSNSENMTSSEDAVRVVETLLNFGIDVNVKDKDGRQPILWAASAGSADAVIHLVSSGACVEAADKDELTALHCAASRGHTTTLETLISLCGANVDVIDGNGCSALFYSVTLGHADATELLLRLGAEPNRQDRKGRTPAHCGAAKGQLETLRILQKHGGNLWMRNVKGDIPLHEAVASGRKDLVLWLLSQNPEAINIANNDGRCPLHIASMYNNTEMVKVLLDSKSLVNPVMRTSKGILMTPLNVALCKGHRSCGKYLQLHGGVPFSKVSKTESGTAVRLSPTDDTIIVNSEMSKVSPQSRNSRSPADGEKNQLIIKSDSTDKKKVYRRRKKKKSPSINTQDSDSDSDDSLHDVKLKTPERRKNENEEGKAKSEKIQLSKKSPRSLSKKNEASEEVVVKTTKPKPETKPLLKNKSFNETKNVSDLSPEDFPPLMQTVDQLDTVMMEPVVNVTQSDGVEAILVKEEIQKKEVKEAEGVGHEDKDVLAKTNAKIGQTETRKVKKAEEKVKEETGNEKVHIIEKKVENEIAKGKVKKGEENMKEEIEKGKPRKAEKDVRNEKTVKREVRKEDEEKIEKDEENKFDNRIKEETENKSLKKIEKDEENKSDNGVKEETEDKLLKKSEEVTENRKPKNAEENLNEEVEKEEIKKASENVVEEIERQITKHTGQSLVEETAKQEEKETIKKDTENGKAEKTEDTGKSEEYTEENTGKEEVKKADGNNEKSELVTTGVQKTEVKEESDEKRDIENEKTGKETSSLLETASKADETVTLKSSDEGSMSTPKTLSVSKNDSKKEKSKSISEKSEKPRKTSSPKSTKTSPPQTLKKQEESIIPKANGGKEDEKPKIPETSEANLPEEKKTEVKEKIEVFTLEKPETIGVSHEKEETETIAEEIKPEEKSVRSSEIPTENKPLGETNEKPSEVFSEKPSIENSLEKGHPIDRENTAEEKTIEKRSPEADDEQEENVKRSEDVTPEEFSKEEEMKTAERSETVFDGSHQKKGNGFENRHYKTPRVSRLCRRHRDIKEDMSQVSVTQLVQNTIRKYHMERGIFYQLLELKRYQIRSGKANEQVLVKRLADEYERSRVFLGMKPFSGLYKFREFEKFLYDQLKALNTRRSFIIPEVKSYDDIDALSGFLKKSRYKIINETPLPELSCTCITQRCHHSACAYTNVPCSAYITDLRHHRHHKPKRECFFPRIEQPPKNSAEMLTERPATLELIQGSEKHVITLPQSSPARGKRYYVTFTIKNAPGFKDEDYVEDSKDYFKHRHAKSV